MDYTLVAEKLGEDFVDQPIEYGAEADLRVQLHQLLTDKLTKGNRLLATVRDPRLIGETRSYKKGYKNTVASKLKERSTIKRIRLDVSVDKRRKYDLVTFNEEIASPIDWVRSGSKRFNEQDLDAVFGLKFIKNKCYPPFQCSITDDRILEMDSAELQSEFNQTENSLGNDIRQLNSLPSDTTAIFILVSNNNYLFLDPLMEEEQAEQKKIRAGHAARDWLQDATEGVGVLYVHPGGVRWIAPLED